MPDSCSLWINLASAGPRRHPHTEPAAYLHFPSTGLVVGLPDEPGLLLDAEGPVRFPLREADANGLGLTTDDLARGVALCFGNEHEPGWRCDPVELVVNDAEGELHLGAGEPGMLESETASTSAPPPDLADERPSPPRALVYVSEQGLRTGAIAAAAARAIEINARVVLAAIGELPESRRHAIEVTRALHRLLAFAAPLFEGRVAALRVELGGDPVHGLLTLAQEEHASMILVPEDSAHRSELDGLAKQLRRRVGLPVESVIAPDRAASERETTTAASGAAAARHEPARRLAIPIGLRDDGPPWERPEAWTRMVRTAVHERVRTAAPVPAGAQCTLTARWFVHPDHPRLAELEGRLPLETIASALAEESYITPSNLPAGSIRSEVVEMDPDALEHVVAVLRC